MGQVSYVFAWSHLRDGHASSSCLKSESDDDSSKSLSSGQVTGSSSRRGKPRSMRSAPGRPWRYYMSPVLKASLIAVSMVTPVMGNARIFADLRPQDLVPRDIEECLNTTMSDCLVEYQSGRYEGAQMHRSAEVDNFTSEGIRQGHARLLVMITTVWRNFQRRRQQRHALMWCRRVGGFGGAAVWKFLLGDAPPALLRRAQEEVEQHEDLLLLGGQDEMDYSHLGDHYELQSPNPELVKIINALRHFQSHMIFDYVLVADDDSFINLPNALDLLNLLPKERVYVGNMIDTIPQRYDKEAGKIKLETSVSLYLGTPSKVPVFAHGMGFLISGDIAKLLADLGLSMKLRGNDDMLFGVWLRSIEYLYYLNYWPWFFDHEDFKGLFSRPCDVTAVVVHRMNAERWRTFDKQECHLCSPTLEPLDVQPGDEPPAPSSEKREPTDKGPKGLAVLGAGQEDQLQKCLSADKIGCSWPAPARAAAMKEELKNGEGACASRCLSEASGPNGTLPRNCPASLCFALCQPPGSDNSLCPSAPSRKRRVPTRGRPTLAICIFGSTWNDAQMRWHLRRSLESCSSQHLGVREGRVKHLFVMGSMPSKMDPLRAPAASELLRHRDIATIQLRNKSSESQSSYSQGWRLVEERFGGADFILFLDHRSFVNVPFILHKIIPELPTQSVIQGMMLDETFFGPCSLKDTGRCGYLMRRRAPTFPHGMGFLVSSDVAKFVSEMEARVPLRQADVPADVAFGMWVQTLEDVPLESDISHFHEFPDDSGISGEKVTELRRPLSGESTVVFPMSPEKWRQFFDAPTCTLTTGVFASSASQASMRASKATAGGSVVAQAKDEIDCWKGMGGRGEAWYLVCCDIGWAGCWGGDFTEALCCGSPPASPAREAGMPAETKVDGLDALGRFLGFDKEELQLLFFAMENATSFPTAPSASGPRFRCLTPTDCAKEAFARFYQGSWSAGFAPLRHPWQVDVQDHLFGLQIKLRTENDGGVPQGHEHTFERVQLANFFRRVQDRVRPEDMPASRRCLEWDSSAMGRHYFKKYCEVFDLVTYMGEGHTELREDPPGGRRNYFVDLHLADRVVPESSAGMVVCVQIFEHLRKPHVAMQQLFRLVDVGGYVVWSAPLFSEVHGAPQDYWRFTPSGAKVLAEDAGFEVLDLYSPGGLREVAGYLLGLTAPYWKKEAFLEDSASSWPLQVYMLLQKPKYA